MLLAEGQSIEYSARLVMGCLFFSNLTELLSCLKLHFKIICIVDLGEYLYFAIISITERQIFGEACTFTHGMCVA